MVTVGSREVLTSFGVSLCRWGEHVCKGRFRRCVCKWTIRREPIALGRHFLFGRTENFNLNSRCFVGLRRATHGKLRRCVCKWTIRREPLALGRHFLFGRTENFNLNSKCFVGLHSPKCFEPSQIRLFGAFQLHFSSHGRFSGAVASFRPLYIYHVPIERQQAEFSKACTTLITNANAPDLIRKVLEQRNTILQMDKTNGEKRKNRTNWR